MPPPRFETTRTLAFPSWTSDSNFRSAASKCSIICRVRHIHDKMLREFTSSHFIGPQEEFFFHGGEVSDAGFNDLKGVLQNAARQCAEVIEHDRGPRADRHGAAFVLALRRWNYSGFSRFKRGGGIAVTSK